VAGRNAGSDEPRGSETSRGAAFCNGDSGAPAVTGGRLPRVGADGASGAAGLGDADADEAVGRGFGGAGGASSKISNDTTPNPNASATTPYLRSVAAEG
jgi:hypothetical protein